MRAMFLAIVLAAGCSGTIDHPTSSPLVTHATTSTCDGTCATDADCGLGLGCADDGTCGIICGNGNTICASDTLCTASGDCFEPCKLSDASVFYLGSVLVGYCPAPFTERQTGQCFMACNMPECTTYGGVNPCDGADFRSRAKPRRLPPSK